VKKMASTMSTTPKPKTRLLITSPDFDLVEQFDAQTFGGGARFGKSDHASCQRRRPTTIIAIARNRLT